MIEIAAGIRPLHGLAALIDDIRLYAGQRQRARARLGVRDPGKRRDEDHAGFRLPPGVDDRAAAAADHPLIPHPRLGIDRLPDAAQQAQAREVVARRYLVSQLHQCADRSGRGVEDADPVVLADLPEASGVGGRGRALIQHHGRSRGERPVGHIAVAGHPADIRGTPEDVVVAQVEHPLRGQLRAEEIAAARMLDSLRLSSRSRGIEQVERMLRLDPLGLADRRLPVERLVPPEIAPPLHRYRPAGALQDDDVLDGLAALGQRLVRRRLELYRVSASPATVRGDQHLGARVLDPVLQRRRGEAPEDHRVDGPDPVAGVHRDDCLRHERQIDRHSIAFAYTLRLQGVREPADLAVQLAVGKPARVARLAFKDDRGLLTALLEMHVETVERDVEAAVREPAIVRSGGVIEGYREGRMPGDLLAGEPSPESRSDLPPPRGACARGRRA